MRSQRWSAGLFACQVAVAGGAAIAVATHSDPPPDAALRKALQSAHVRILRDAEHPLLSGKVRGIAIHFAGSQRVLRLGTSPSPDNIETVGAALARAGWSVACGPHVVVGSETALILVRGSHESVVVISRAGQLTLIDTKFSAAEPGSFTCS